MVESVENITDTYVLSPDRSERYLRTWESEGRALAQLGVTGAGVAELVPPYRIERRDSEHHVVIYSLGGSGRYDGGTILPGNLFVYPAGPQLYWSNHDWDMIWFHLKPGRFSALDELEEPTTRPFSGGERLKALMNAYCDEQSVREIHNGRAIEAYADLIAVLLERNLDAGRDPLRADTLNRLAAIWRLVEDAPARPWTVADLAHAYGLSSVQFHRTVTHALGITPMRKVADIRLNAACQLLLTRNLTLDAIADAVGFASPFSLSRAFKRHFGSSPRHFRRQHVTKV